MIDLSANPDEAYSRSRCIRSLKYSTIDAQIIDKLKNSVNNFIPNKESRCSKYVKPCAPSGEYKGQPREPYDFCNLELLMMVNIFYQKDVYDNLIKILKYN